MNYITVGNIIQTEINQQQTLKEHTESSPMTGERVESQHIGDELKQDSMSNTQKKNILAAIYD